jgi:hypothetical protein
VATRRIGISEARRLLPELVRSIASEGGRVDITYRGKPQVSLLRVSDVKQRPSPPLSEDPALRMKLRFPADDLVSVLRELRSTQGQARTRHLPDAAPAPPARKRSPRKRAQRR